MNEKKPNLDSLMKGNKNCIKCGSKIPSDDVSGKCEIMQCPKCAEKK